METIYLRPKKDRFSARFKLAIFMFCSFLVFLIFFGGFYLGRQYEKENAQYHNIQSETLNSQISVWFRKIQQKTSDRDWHERLTFTKAAIRNKTYDYLLKHPILQREKRAFLSYLVMLQRGLAKGWLFGYTRREEIEAEIKFVEAHLEYLELQIRLATFKPKLNYVMFKKATIIPAILNDRCFDCIHGRMVHNLNRSSICLLENPGIHKYGCINHFPEEELSKAKTLKAELV